MLLDPPPREYISPVVCWTSDWSAGNLVKATVNKECRAYKKAYDKECVRKTDERRLQRLS